MRRDLAVEPIQALLDPDTLEELRERLGRDRLLPAVAEGWDRGMPRPWLAELLADWATFDVAGFQARLDELTHLRAHVGGLSVHLVHAPGGPDPLPLPRPRCCPTGRPPYAGEGAACRGPAAGAHGGQRLRRRARPVPQATQCRSAREGTPMWTECSAYGTMNLPGCLPVTPANLATGAAPDPGSPSFSCERLLTGRSRWHSRALPRLSLTGAG